MFPTSLGLVGSMGAGLTGTIGRKVLGGLAGTGPRRTVRNAIATAAAQANLIQREIRNMRTPHQGLRRTTGPRFSVRPDPGTNLPPGAADGLHLPGPTPSRVGTAAAR